MTSDGDVKAQISRRGQVGVVLGALSVLLLGLLVADFFDYPSRCRTYAPACNRGENGLWLRYLWYFDKKPEGEMADILKRVKDNKIRYVYFHVLDVTPDGNLRNKRLASARKMIERFRKDAPGTQLIAWVSAGDWYPAHGTDLTKPAVIDNMVIAAQWLVNDCGFDGVQWDYEPCHDADDAFVRLVEKTKTALPMNKLLSVASPMVYPCYFPFGWSPAYFEKVAKHCDQIAVMAYDSGYPHPRAYERLMRYQIPTLTQAVYRSNPNCRLIIGVPTYDRNWLHDHTETLKLALVGLRNGLADPRTNKTVFAGVAPFAEYTTDEREWKTYKELWLD